MRLSCKAVFLMLAAWLLLAGLVFGGFVLIAYRAAHGPVPPLVLVPISLSLAAVLSALTLWSLQKMARLRLQQLRAVVRQPNTNQLPAAPPVRGLKGDPFSVLAQELERVFDRWEEVHQALLTTQEEELREAKTRLAELTRQNADLKSELTETREARALSAGMEALFVKTFEAAPLGMAVMTTREGCFSEVNAKLLDILGYERDEVVNHSDEELKFWGKPKTRERFVREMSESQESQKLHGVECQLRTKSGQVRKVALSVTPTTVHETPCLILTVQDPDERMRMELELVQNQKMEAVGQLAAGMAHDFNNILMIVQGYTSLLMTDPKLDEKSGEALRHVSVAADRAAHLTRQLLAFSRKQLMHPRAFQLNELVQGMSSMLQQLFGNEVRLMFDLAPETATVEADPSMLQEVIMNLALNARDAMGKRGEFSLQTSAITFDRAAAKQRPDGRPGNFVCLTVRDNGGGIDPAILDRIFEPFFTTKEVGKGTGLGLATVYGIVKQHNGWIEVASQLGEGTTFRIYLEASSRGAPKVPVVETKLDGAETILVVEDEPGLRALIPGMLKSYGYKVLTAANGADALRLWQKNGPQVDLLLTDMVLPEGLSGRALADKLRLDTPDLKVIYTSGYSVDVLSEKTSEFVEGVNFLQKPYRPQRLAETIRTCLAQAEEVAAH